MIKFVSDETYLDRVAEEFQEDSDVAETLDLYARGFIKTKEYLGERLEFLLKDAERRAQRYFETEDEEAEKDMGDSMVSMERDAGGPWEAA